MVLRNKLSQISFRVGFIILTVYAIGSCSTPLNDEHTIQVLTLRGPSAMSMLHLINDNNKIGGKKIEYEILDEPLQIRARLLKEEPEMAMMPTNMAANLYNKGVPYKLAAISVWGSLEVLGYDANIKNWEDLRGKRVHLMGKGMTPDILFRYLAKENNLDPETDLILDYSFPTHSDLANAVIAGRSEIAVLSEPLVSMVKLSKNRINTIFNLDDEWKKVLNNDFSIPQTSLLVKTSFANENPEFIVSFLNKYQEACEKIESDIHKTGQLAVKYEILPDTIVAQMAIQGCNLHVRPSWEVKEKVEAYLRVFYNFNPKSIGGQMPDADFFFEK